MPDYRTRRPRKTITRDLENIQRELRAAEQVIRDLWTEGEPTEERMRPALAAHEAARQRWYGLARRLAEKRGVSESEGRVILAAAVRRLRGIPSDHEPEGLLKLIGG